MNDRYFKREYEHEYYIFDSEVITEDEFEEKYEYEGYRAFEDCMMGDTVVDRLNKYNKEYVDCYNDVLMLEKENEELKQEVEMLRNGLKAYDEALPLYLDCEDIMHFKSSELYEFEMERMDFYKKYPNRVHYR